MKKQSKEETSNPPPSVWSDVMDLIRPRRGLLLLGFVLIVISRLAGFVLPASTKPLFDEVIGKGRMDLLMPIVLAVLGATLVQGVTAFALTQLLSKDAQRMIAELRRTVQEHMGRLPVAYYDSNKTGALVSRIMSDVEGVRNLVGTGLVDLLGGLLTAVGALAVLIYVSPSLTAMAICMVAVFIFVLQKAFKTLRPIFRERSRIRADVTGRLTESLGGVRVVKGYHAEAREASVFSAGVERLLQNVLSTLTGTALVGLAASLLLGAAGALVMYYGARQIAAGVLLPGDMVMFTLFLGLLVAPLYQMVSIGTQITEAVAGLERTREVLREIPEDHDPRRTVELGEIRGTVRFDNVSFAYEAGKPVLHDVSFESRPGTVTALVGPSGSGKSTIIGLVAAFHVPTEGTVWVDGVDLSTVKLSSYRTQLGVVLQDTFLFAGSIRENIAFARPDAGDEQIIAACRIARVDEFAESFEHKYATIVGERGVRLSGGQRQRVSIARAILADPRILILDEATSSLDSESEALIQEGLSYLMKGRTTFVIAHRLSTIRRADQILVIEQGRVHEHGTHQSLYALGGRYYDLYTKQHGVESNLFLAPGEGAVGDDGSPIGSGVEDNGAGSEPGGDRDADSPLRVLRGE
jgi:subfamily B ATP-binding cassette protein MsbA